ncbi:hypothetical protein H0H93_014346 [Arthromyces matolae]|nr:hypothetical protein H0H93_014346 [Arthromyces matolae]
MPSFMSSRSAFLAPTTPDVLDSHLTVNPASTSSCNTASDPPTPPEETANGVLDHTPSFWQAWQHSVAETLKANTGLLLIAAAQAFFSMMNVAVKILNSIDPPVPTLELIFVRMFVTYVFSLIYMLATGVPDPVLGPKGIRLLLAFRGFSGFFGLFGIYYSLQFLSLSDATVLTFLAPLCTGIAGAIFLKEKYTKAQAAASLCSLVGVILIARPTFLFKQPTRSDFTINDYDFSFAHEDTNKVTPEQRLIAVCVAMLGVFGATGAYVSIAAMGKRAHPMHAMLSFSSQSVIAAVIGMTIQKTNVVIPTKVEWAGMLVMIGVFGFVAQTLLTMGLQRETAGRGSIAIYTQLVFASIFERVFFQAETSFLSVTGTFIIVSSALYVAITKQRAQQAKNTVKLRGASEAALEEGLLSAASADEQNQNPKHKPHPAGDMTALNKGDTGALGSQDRPERS